MPCARASTLASLNLQAEREKAEGAGTSCRSQSLVLYLHADCRHSVNNGQLDNGQSADRLWNSHGGSGSTGIDSSDVSQALGLKLLLACGQGHRMCDVQCTPAQGIPQAQGILWWHLSVCLPGVMPRDEYSHVHGMRQSWRPSPPFPHNVREG